MSKLVYYHLSQEGQNEDQLYSSTSQPHLSLAPSEALESSWKRKLSVVAALILSIAILSVPAVIWFLCFLWVAVKYEGQSEFWLKIINQGWMLRCITTAALVIRTAISTIAIYMTSMLACIIVERQGIILHTAASISAIRFINNGPSSLLIALRNTIPRSWLWLGVTLLLFCTTTLLQFISTVLVLDIGYGVLTVSPQSNTTRTGMSLQNANQTNIMTIQPIPYWVINSERFPTFAEYTEPIPSGALPESVRDTGIILRAFLPFENVAQRTSVKQFQGVATVFDSRTVYIRPRSHSRLALVMTKDTGWLLNGALMPDAVVPGLALPNQPLLLADLGKSIVISLNRSQVNGTETRLDWIQSIP